MNLTPGDIGRSDGRRQLARLGARFFLEMLGVAGHAVPGDLVDLLVFLTIARRNAKGLEDDPARFAAMDDVLINALRKPVSINGVARSLDLPFETVRRHVRRLLAKGLCQTLENGLIIPEGVVGSERFLAAVDQSWRLGCDLVNDAVRAGAFPMPARHDSTLDMRRHGARLAIGYVLDILQTGQRTLDLAPLDLVMMRAISYANVENLTQRGGADFAGLSDVPDDGARRPVTVYALAKSLMLPYETARRHAAGLVDRGLATRTDEGLVIPTALISRPRMVAMTHAFARLTEDLTERLAAAGACTLDLPSLA